MAPGQFDYLLSAPRQSAVSPDRLETFAKTAAKRYVEEKAPLNDTISKLAEENDLNKAQIERVCELANIATHQALWPKTAEKVKVAFPLADSKAITKHHKDKPASSEKSPCACGSSTSDYAGPPSGLPVSGPSLSSLMGADPANVHNGLTSAPERKQIIVVIEKKAAERGRLRGEAAIKAMEAESAEKRAYYQRSRSGGRPRPARPPS